MGIKGGKGQGQEKNIAKKKATEGNEASKHFCFRGRKRKARAR